MGKSAGKGRKDVAAREEETTCVTQWPAGPCPESCKQFRGQRCGRLKGPLSLRCTTCCELIEAACRLFDLDPSDDVLTADRRIGRLTVFCASDPGLGVCDESDLSSALVLVSTQLSHLEGMEEPEEG
jgi:hypothetical protein